MGKKLGLHSLFFRSAKDHKPRYSSSSSSSSFPFSSSPPSWTWSSCRNPRTHSFRKAGDDVCKTANSIYFDSSESFPAFSEEEAASFSTMSASDESPTAEPAECFIRGLRSSGRLFFEPGSTSPSIMEEAGVPFKESVVLAMESLDPLQ
ncbi:hypothetical protein AXF42_Ash011222 [Apostasia shenzhenica]|uniref:Uncharacterized protein n=1 Tax=Apostasia shenzhenica TaxID=1088818 RepID=A0A2I0AL48_9ASPA|nr:hypothetical protein AXF42_Ash011222 [Apostasia shenzhenica]